LCKLEKRKSSHSINLIGYHLVWCTKFRHPILKDGVDIIVKQAIGETCFEYNWSIKAIEVMPDHVHIFLQANPEDKPIDIVKTLKSISSVAVFYSFPKLKGQKFWGSCLWFKGSYYASVGQIFQVAIKNYILSQKSK
jgi:putative transposase